MYGDCLVYLPFDLNSSHSTYLEMASLDSSSFERRHIDRQRPLNSVGTCFNSVIASAKVRRSFCILQTYGLRMQWIPGLLPLPPANQKAWLYTHTHTHNVHHLFLKDTLLLFLLTTYHVSIFDVVGQREDIILEAVYHRLKVVFFLHRHHSK